MELNDVENTVIPEGVKFKSIEQTTETNGMRIGYLLNNVVITVNLKYSCPFTMKEDYRALLNSVSVHEEKSTAKLLCEELKEFLECRQ